MSRRAEALAKQIDDILEQGSMGTKGLPEAAALIDAELRKERERAAERIKETCIRAHAEELIDCKEDRDKLYTALRAAILKED